MTKQRVTFGLLITAGCMIASGAAAETLRMAHFWPEESRINKQVFQAWADAVEEESDGSITIENYASQTLLDADESYDGVVDGIADITITAQGYTAGRFPLSQIVELPGVSMSATQGACVLQTLYDEGHIASEYEDTHVLFLFTNGPGYLHFADENVRTPEDLEGLRVRRATTTAAYLLEQVGADPVGMPMPEVYTSLQRGVVDGLGTQWEGMKVFGLTELTNYHLEVPFYSLSFVATMSQDTYNRLSPEQQEVIDNNSGMKWSETAGEVFHELDVEARQEAMDAGHTIHEVDNPLEHDEWGDLLHSGIENYLNELEENGYDNAREIYEAAMEASEACGADTV